MGKAVHREIKKRNFKHRLVSRSINSDLGSIVKANLLNSDDAHNAIEGSTYVYLCVGLPYHHKIWENQWEIIIKNVINACIKHEAKLIFLDNIYMYSPNLPLHFDEQTAQQPNSKKGRVRKIVADYFLQAVVAQGLIGLIARSADFYGNSAVNSIIYKSFLERILAGKNPQLLSSGDVAHTFAHVDDNARAMVSLALCDECYGQVWHLPVGNSITMNELLGIVNNLQNTNFKNEIIPKLLKKILPKFRPMLREALEMQYQFEQPYVISFDKFKNRFPNFEATSYEKGIKEMINGLIDT